MIRWLLISLLGFNFSQDATLTAGRTSIGGQEFAWDRPVFPLANGCQGIRSDSRGRGYYGAPRGHGSHSGVDWHAAIGEPVVSPWPGVVTAATNNAGAFGRFVEVTHSNGFVTRYGHLNTVNVSRNQQVSAGTVLGTVGKSGNARHSHTHPHLHFELRTNRGSRLNPSQNGFFSCDCYAPQSIADRRRPNVAVCTGR